MQFPTNPNAAPTLNPALNPAAIGPTLVDQLTNELTQAAGAHGLQAAAGLFSWARAANALRRGSWVEANLDAQQWIQGAEALDPLSVSTIFSQAMAAYTAAAVGDSDRATRLCEAVLASDAAKRFPEISAWCWAASGSLAYTQGDLSGALDLLARVDEVADVVSSNGCLGEPTRLYWEGDWIDALIDAQRIEEALVAVDKLRAYGQSTGDLWSLGVVARCAGRMEPVTVAAEALFQQAMNTFEQGRLEFEIARTFCIRGAHFRGERAGASFDIAEGFRRLQRIGAVQWANWSAGLLRTESESLRKIGRSHYTEPSLGRGPLTMARTPNNPVSNNGESNDAVSNEGARNEPISNEGARNEPMSNERTTRELATLETTELTRGRGTVGIAGTIAAVGPQRSTTEVPLQLTPSELRVASLITTGSTYKEIAGALFISTKTVDFHVQAMYRKARVNNRVEFVGSFLRLAHS